MIVLNVTVNSVSFLSTRFSKKERHTDLQLISKMFENRDENEKCSAMGNYNIKAGNYTQNYLCIIM